MRRISNKRDGISLNSVILALIIITCAIPKGLDIFTFPANVERPYGSTIGLTMQMILLMLLVFTKKGRIQRGNIPRRAFLPLYLIWGIFSVVFIPINGADPRYYLVAAFKFIVYLIAYYLLSGSMTIEAFYKGIDIGFKIGMLLQTITGFAYVFFGVLIPFIGSYSTTIRNGLSRMVGTFAHPGDFSLYISILTVYFVCKWLFSNKKGALIYALVGALDILLSGARAMLISTTLIVFIILMRRNRKNPLYKLAIIAIAAIGIFSFIRSDTFLNLFLKMNFLDMLQARLIHWIIGLRVMFRSLFNFLCGVGLNGHVDYIDAHFIDFYGLVAESTVLNSDFARGMPIHNSFLIAGSELGTIGIYLYLRIYIENIKKSICTVKKVHSLKMHGVFIMSAFVIYAAYAMQGWALQKDFGMMMLVVLCAYSDHINARIRTQ